jgi:hypothetical protein
MKIAGLPGFVFVSRRRPGGGPIYPLEPTENCFYFQERAMLIITVGVPLLP